MEIYQTVALQVESKYVFKPEKEIFILQEKTTFQLIQNYVLLTHNHFRNADYLFFPPYTCIQLNST